MNLSIAKSTPSLVDAAPGIGMCPAPRIAKLVLVATRIGRAPATSCESVGVKMHQGDRTVDSDQNSVMTKVSVILESRRHERGDTLVLGIINRAVGERDEIWEFGS